MLKNQVKASVEAKLNLTILLKGHLQLLTVPSEELQTILEEDLKDAPYVFQTMSRRVRWFRQDLPAPQVASKRSWWESILQQIKMELDGTELDVAMDIIYCLDDRGFFRGDVNSIAERWGVHPDYVEDIREFIMKELEPTGIASKSMEEFIKVQIEEMFPDNGDLLKEVLEFFRTGRASKAVKELAGRLKLYPAEDETTEYSSGSVDLLLEWDGEEWYVVVRDDFIEIGGEEDLPKEVLEKVKRWNVLLSLRRNILRKAGELILERQKDFLLGKGPLKSLTMSELAQVVNVSLSSVSRVLSNKYVKTPVGVFPIKFFFKRESKDGYSTEEVLRAVKEVIQQLGDVSDRKLCEALRAKGINLARRTVCKYRRMLSHERHSG